MESSLRCILAFLAFLPVHVLADNTTPAPLIHWKLPIPGFLQHFGITESAVQRQLVNLLQPPSLTDLLNRLGITVSQTEQLIRWDTTSVVSSLITYAVPIVLVAVVMGYAWIVFGLVQFEVAAVGNSPKRQDEFPSDFYPLDAYPSGAYPSNVYSLDANISDTNLSDANPWGVNPSDAYPSDAYHSDGLPSDVYPSYVYQHPIRQDQNNNNNLFSSEPQTNINESHSQPINDGNSKEDSHQEKKKKGVKKIKMKGWTIRRT